MILKLLLNTQMIWIRFMKILKNTIQVRNAKKITLFHDMIADTLSNKKLEQIATEVFIRGRN